jgi:hypothetical protein
MKLHIDPPLALDLLGQDLDLVICVTETTLPVVYTAENSANPDRHFLLGVVQTALIAIEELDPDTVAFINSSLLTLEKNDELIRLNCQLIIIRSKTGGFAVLTRTDQTLARRLIREAARRFTGLIRLDIP